MRTMEALDFQFCSGLVPRPGAVCVQRGLGRHFMPKNNRRPAATMATNYTYIYIYIFCWFVFYDF